MKIIFLTNNEISESLINWLRIDAKEEVIVISDNLSKEVIEEYKPDILISYNYRYLIKKDVLDLLPNRVINLHTSLLPWNRGAHPNVWSFLEDTLKEVTIHYIDEGLDTGNIIVQKEVFIDEEKETLKSSYEILNREIQEVFKKNWDKIKADKFQSQKQVGGGAYTTSEKVNFLSLLSKTKDGIRPSENLKKNMDFGDVILKNFINLTENEMIMILEWRNHVSVRKEMYQDHIISIEEHSKFIEKLKYDNKNYYWILKSKNGECMGTISLNRVDFRNKNAYFGIYSNPFMKGAGSLLIECLKKLAFDIANLHTLKLEVIDSNERAINFYKKSGFIEEGRLKEFVFKDDKWYDVIVMGILNRDDGQIWN